MTLSPVYIGRPQETREPVEQRVYDLLDALQISYQRVDHDPAYDMDACAGISQALGVHICKNLLLTPRNRSAFYLLAMPEDLPFRTADFSADGFGKLRYKLNDTRILVRRCCLFHVVLQFLFH